MNYLSPGAENVEKQPPHDPKITPKNILLCNRRVWSDEQGTLSQLENEAISLLHSAIYGVITLHWTRSHKEEVKCPML